MVIFLCYNRCMSNSDFAGLKRFETITKIFNGLIYFNIVVVVLLFLVFGINWIVNRDYYNAGGAGTMIALLYCGPIILVNVVAFTYFLILSILAVSRKKINQKVVARLYKKSGILFGVEILVSMIALACIF